MHVGTSSKNTQVLIVGHMWKHLLVPVGSIQNEWDVAYTNFLIF